MALVLADRVLEQTATTGTGTLSLTGALTGYETFSSAVGNGNTTYYTIELEGSAEYEVGLGTVAAGTLTRDTVLASSNSDALVNLSAGVKRVFCTYPANKMVFLDASGDLILAGGLISQGITDADAGGIRLDVNDADIRIGGTGTSSFAFTRGNSAAAFVLGGGAGINDGAQLVLYGSTTVGLEYDIRFLAGVGNSTELEYDDSASLWDFQANAVRTSSGFQIIDAVSTSSQRYRAENSEGYAEFGSDGGAFCVWVNGDQNIVLSADIMDVGRSSTDFSIVHKSNDSKITMSGGSAAASGLNMQFFGGAHATNASDWVIRANSTTVLFYDDSANSMNFQDNAIITTGDINGGNIFATNDLYVDTVSGNAEFFMRPAGVLNYAVTSQSGTGGDTFIDNRSATGSMIFRTGGTTTALTLSSAQLATFAGNVVMDATLTVTDRFVAGASEATFGTTGAAYTLALAADDQSVFVSGGNAFNSGANWRLYGGTHATVANDAQLRSSGTVILSYDDSASTFTFGDGDGNLIIQNTQVTIPGNGASSSELFIGNVATSTGTCKLEIGTGRTGDGASYIDLVADSLTYTDYALRLIRNSGANGTTEILHRGTGNLNISTNEAANINIETDSTRRWVFNSAGALVSYGGIIRREVDTDSLVIGGSNNSTTGGILELYGGSHATRADDFTVRAGSTNVLDYDDSADTLTISTNLAMADHEVSGGLFRGVGNKGYAIGNITGTATYDVDNGNFQTATVTGAVTLTVTNWFTSGDLTPLILKVINAGTNLTITNADYGNAGEPSLQASGTDWLQLWSDDGGTTVSVVKIFST